MLSERLNQLQPSKTIAADNKAKALKKEGKDIISLTLGEPDFDTPDEIVEAAIKALKEHKGEHYTPASGTESLKEAIAAYHEREDKIHYSTDQVFTANGSKLVLFDLIQTLINPGDEVIVPSPHWVSYLEQIKLAGGKAVIVETQASDGFKLRLDELKKALTPKTKALILNNPSNPSGMVLDKKDLEAIGNFAVENDLWIISDEIYGFLVYNGTTFTSMAALSEAIKEKTIVVSGLSKSFAMTGWRLGYALGPVEIIQGLGKFAGQVSGNPAGISQYAAEAALKGPFTGRDKMRKAFEKRLNLAYDLVNTLPGFKLEKKPQGAFYLFPDVSEAVKLAGYSSVEDFSNALLEEAGVGAVIGEAFGKKNHLRFSYATSEDLFEEGMKRIQHFMDKKMKK